MRIEKAGHAAHLPSEFHIQKLQIPVSRLQSGLPFSKTACIENVQFVHHHHQRDYAAQPFFEHHTR